MDETTASEKRFSAIPLFLTGGIFILYGQFFISGRYFSYFPYERRSDFLIAIVIGVILAFCGAWIALNGEPRWLKKTLDWLSQKLSVQGWQIICLFMALPMAILVPIAAGEIQRMICPYGAVVAWLSAIFLVIAGTWKQPTPLKLPSIHLVALVVGLTTLAFLLRGTLTDRIPIILTGDEGSAGLASTYFLRGESDNIFITSWYSFPSLYFLIQATSIRLFGETTQALRIPSALAGSLTVLATFFVARAMFGKRAAWFAALFLAAFHFHIHFSRIGLNNIWDGLWYIVTVGAFWYGWEKDRRNAYILAGLALGISQYFYPSSRTILALIIAWLLLAVILDRPRLKKNWKNVLYMIFVALIVMLPLGWYYYKHPNTFFEPMARVGLTREWLAEQVQNTSKSAFSIVLKQLLQGFGGYTYYPLRAWYIPETPILLPMAALFFIIGIVLLLVKGGKWRIFPLLLWLSAFAFIGALSESTPAAQRYVAVAPVCALLVGFGLSGTFKLLEKILPKIKRLLSPLSIALCIILVMVELNFYFLRYTPHSVLSLARTNGVVAQTLANYLKTQPDDTQVIFFGYPYMGYYGIPSLQYLNPEIEAIDMVAPWSSPGDPRITSSRLIFVFLPSHVDQIPFVQVDYPGGVLTEIQAFTGETLYWMYQITTPSN